MSGQDSRRYAPITDKVSVDNLLVKLSLVYIRGWQEMHSIWRFPEGGVSCCPYHLSVPSPHDISIFHGAGEQSAYRSLDFAICLSWICITHRDQLFALRFVVGPGILFAQCRLHESRHLPFEFTTRFRVP